MQLPDVSKMSPDDCAIDFKLRCKSRRNYPGACSLEYQNLMQIVIECLLNWDMSTNCSKGPGIFGETIAFARADEEQGRGSLHGHWQIWIKELSQKQEMHYFILIHQREQKLGKSSTNTSMALYVLLLIRNWR